MKTTSIRYLIGEGFKNTWVNRLMSIASIGVLMACMVIIGLAMLITENVDKAMGNLEQQNIVIAYMKDYNWALYGDTKEDASSVDTTSSEANTETPDKNGIKSSDYIIHNEEEAKALCDEIAKIPNVSSVTFISSEEGLEEIKDSMLKGQEEFFTFLDDEYGNPMSCAAKVSMTDMSLFDETVEKISKLSGVDIIQSQSGLAEKITAIKKGIGVAGAWIISILIIIALVIVSNTIRVTMYNRKLEISIMKAVGATDTFIRIPFIVEGMVIGLISALLAEGVLYFCYRVATETIISQLGTNDIIRYGEMAGWIFLIFVGIGLFAGILGSAIMIGKYLKHEGSEFAAI